MPNVTVYIRNEDYEKWKALPNKSKIIAELLNKDKFPSPKEYAEAWNKGAKNYLHVPQIPVPPVTEKVKGPFEYSAEEDKVLKNVKVNLTSPKRTYQQIAVEAHALKAQLEFERKDNAENQDPDYWSDFNERFKQVDELWAEYHQLKGE